MMQLHPSFPTILFDDKDQSCRLGSSMIRWIYATWIISWRSAKLAASGRRPRCPYRPAGHVRRHRPARAGSRDATVRRERHAGSPDRVRATLQAGAQRILDAVLGSPGRHCGRLWPGLRHGYLGNHSSTPNHLTSPTSWKMSATAIQTLSLNCASPRTVSGAPAIGRRRVNGYRPIASAAKRVTY